MHRLYLRDKKKKDVCKIEHKLKNVCTLNITLLFIFSIAPCIGQTSATYDIRFISAWNATDHTSLPENAHWSKLVGATHKTANAFLQIGNLATTGIKNIAELGNKTVFNTEVTSKISSGEADQYINGPSLGTATGTILISDLVVSEEYPLLTIVSMVAPSPDWMIAVNGYNLLDAEGKWKTSVTLDMFVYDAGTDSGTDYASANSITDPFQPISIINGLPFNGIKTGTLTITLKTVSGVNDNPLFYMINLFPNPVSGGKITLGNLDGIIINKLEIINVSGTQIKSYNENLQGNTLALDTQNLSSGIYLLKLTTDKNNTVVRKFVIL
jgi:hypothetical protein